MHFSNYIYFIYFFILSRGLMICDIFVSIIYQGSEWGGKAPTRFLSSAHFRDTPPHFSSIIFLLTVTLPL